ncbi:hypothetical protein RIF29_15549 [Crotalaria pallida]|uniref:Uncharacterized protein n=1 Tax=Crotalaria pallida TaxID=3830 RepID=A0AAN9FF90_CROPI
MRKGEKAIRKEWVVKDKPTQKEILHVVDSIKVQDQINSGLIPADRVKDSELHSLVVESNTATQNGQNMQKEVEADPVPKPASTSEVVPKEQEWYTVTRRRAQMQKSNDVVGNKGSEGGGSDPSNG